MTTMCSALSWTLENPYTQFAKVNKMGDIAINVSGHAEVKSEVDAAQKGLAVLLERKIGPRMDSRGLLVETRRIAHDGFTYIIVNEAFAVFRKSESNIKLFAFSAEQGVHGEPIVGTLKSEAKLFDLLFDRITAAKGGVTQPELDILEQPTAEEAKQLSFVEQLFDSKVLQSARASLTYSERPYIQEVRLPIFASSEFDPTVIQELYVCTVVDHKAYDEDHKKPNLEVQRQPVIFVNEPLQFENLTAAEQFDRIIDTIAVVSKFHYTEQHNGDAVMFFADAGKVGGDAEQKIGLLSICKSPVYLDSVEVKSMADCKTAQVRELFEETTLKFYYCGHMRDI